MECNVQLVEYNLRSADANTSTSSVTAAHPARPPPARTGACNKTAPPSGRSAPSFSFISENTIIFSTYTGLFDVFVFTRILSITMMQTQTSKKLLISCFRLKPYPKTLKNLRLALDQDAGQNQGHILRSISYTEK